MSGIWEPLVRVDSQQRRFELVYEDDRMDAWVLSWMPGQGTGFHDHYVSSVGLACVQGGVREDWLRFGTPSSSSSCGRATRARGARATSTVSVTRPASPR